MTEDAFSVSHVTICAVRVLVTDALTVLVEIEVKELAVTPCTTSSDSNVDEPETESVPVWAKFEMSELVVTVPVVDRLSVTRLVIVVS